MKGKGKESLDLRTDRWYDRRVITRDDTDSDCEMKGNAALMKGITAFVWCYNEEKRLADTLKSLSEYDEVVVIDKSSTDRSAEIAREFGCKFAVVDYYDSFSDQNAVKAVKEIWDGCENEWLLEVTCSDVQHPGLYACMKEMINSGREMDAVEIPLYRYSMGFTSKNSYFGDVQYQAKLFRKSRFDWDAARLHFDPGINMKNIARLTPKDPKIGIYHLTHADLDTILERHLRYARVEAGDARKTGSRKENLDRSWRAVLRQVKDYVKLGTYKLGDRGRAQLCMLLIYRCANYLNLFMDENEEKAIKETYDKFKNGEF